MKIIKGNRRELEKALLKMLVQKNIPDEFDALASRLQPQGKLKLVPSTKSRHHNNSADDECE